MKTHRTGRNVLALTLALAIFVMSRWPTPDVRAQRATPQAEMALAEAQKAGAELTDRVRGLLLSELERGGYEGAVKVCAEIAQNITAEYVRTMGYSARRVSLKYRNPKDAPDAYETRILKKFEAQTRAKKLPSEFHEIVRRRDRQVFRYLKPIVVGKMCLQCHGNPAQIAPGVRAILQRNYPQDRAVGYREGDLRGAVSVTIELPLKSGGRNQL